MLILYSTLGCHLCDHALDIIYDCLGRDFGVSVEDIANDNSLMDLYGIRIPVVKHRPSGEEIGWPFSHEEFMGWWRQLEND